MEPQSSLRTQRKDLVGFIFDEIKGRKKKGKDRDLSKIVGNFVKENGAYCRKVTIGLIFGSESNHRSGFCYNIRLGCAWSNVDNVYNCEVSKIKLVNRGKFQRWECISPMSILSIHKVKRSM